ncbi:MAG: tetratricopeptide repeat protein, partial [Bacteroides sp.]|nr:tetratricopeptide repeat protein [Bacteroides sp.]
MRKIKDFTIRKFGLIGLSSLVLTCSISLQAQNERKVNRQGVKSYEHGAFSEAEVQFRKAGDIDQESFVAEFNTGAALYKQEKYEESFNQYETLAEKAEDPSSMANVWHNAGNSLLEAQKYEESIEAYKNSLRLNPSDQDTKYNLAYAKQKLQEQQEQEQNQDQQDQENQDQQDQENQDQQDQENQDQQDQENQDQQDQENQDQQDQENQEPQEQEEKEQQAQPLEISREDAERMLDAIQQQEKDV